jgi:hypothetical protein
MTDNRESLISKIQALMSKTVAHGCTEQEALAALDKARALMDAYEVTEADLQLTQAESAVLRSEPPGSRDPHRIKSGMAIACRNSAIARSGAPPPGLCSADCRAMPALQRGCSII